MRALHLRGASSLLRCKFARRKRSKREAEGTQSAVPSANVYSQLVRLVLFSSAVHQTMFSRCSSLPFAIGQVQDAGLIFLSKMADDTVKQMQAAGVGSTITLTLGGRTDMPSIDRAGAPLTSRPRCLRCSSRRPPRRATPT